MGKILVVLQNAYSPSARRRAELQDPEALQEGIWGSYTGSRLQQMLPENCEVRVVNSTPEIGTHSDSVLKPDLDYLWQEIDAYDPDLILACGRVAQEAVAKVFGLVNAPHPASRRLSKKEIAKIRRKLSRLLQEEADAGQSQSLS